MLNRSQLAFSNFAELFFDRKERAGINFFDDNALKEIVAVNGPQ